jgi:hypothetical protein
MPRGYIRYADSHGLRTKVPSRAYALVRPFLERCTDSVGLSSIDIGVSQNQRIPSQQPGSFRGLIGDDPVLGSFARCALGEAVTGEHAELARTVRALFPDLPAFRGQPPYPGSSELRSIQWDHDPRSPEAARPTHEAFATLLRRWEEARAPFDLFVSYHFRLVDPEGGPLPFGDEAPSFVQLFLENAGSTRAVYNLKLPWSEPGAALSAVVASLRGALTSFDPRRFRLRTLDSHGNEKMRPLAWSP